MKPKLSIIIPCYNCQDTLEEAVTSIYQQSLDCPFEVIMVDDCSTDKSKGLEEDLIKKYPNISFYKNEKNLGGGATRNVAVEKSTGDIIFCLDSDDVLPKGTLAKMVKFLEEKGCDGVTIHRSMKFSGDSINNIHHIEISPYPDKEIGLETLFAKNQSFFPLYVNFMYTRKAFDKSGGYPTTHGYDTQGFAWNFLCAELKAYTCPEAEYLHRINFNESYYLREYNNGKNNYNWRDILINHYYVFNKEALDFICAFNCQDFTKSLMDKLIEKENILRPDLVSILRQNHPPFSTKFPKPIYIQRNSPKGYYLRAKYRVNSMTKKITDKIKQLQGKTCRYSYSVLISPFVKKVNKKDFANIYTEQKKNYLTNRSHYNFEEFVMPEWKQNMLEIEKYFLGRFSFSFLNNPVIKRTMFMYTFRNWRDTQKKLITEYFKKKQAKEILREYNIGHPLLNDAEYISSGNSIHHLYHLVKFFTETKTKAEDFKTVVEVGGGYGNMARIFKKLNGKMTYIIIDIPIFSFIQLIYLKTILGREAVVMVSSNEKEIKAGKINIIPLDRDLVKEIGPSIKCDLFISTWALSESNQNMQNLVKNLNYFNGKYILLSYQKSNPSFSYAEEVRNIAGSCKSIFNKETEYTKDNYYLFCCK